jgi:uncharacterized protein
MKRILLGVSSILFMLSAGAASFDCSKAQSNIEKTICASTELQILDLKLYEAYSRSLRLALEAKNIRADQLRWLGESRNECKTKECLVNAYNERISALNSSVDYKECEGALSTVGQGYCEVRHTKEAESSIRDLIKVLSVRYEPQQVEKFNNIQTDWRRNVVCDCDKEVGNVMGPGDSLNFSICERKAVEQRLAEIREILAGLHDIGYGAAVPSCAKLRAEEEADPKHKMIQAITNNDSETVKLLLGEGIRLPQGSYSFTPLDIAARNNNIEMVSLLLTNGADPKEDTEAMMASLKTCNMKMVSLLVDHGYEVKGNPSIFGIYDPVPWAAFFGCTDIIKYFVSKGADVNFDNPLRQAANQCHVDTVEYFLSKVWDSDIPDGDHRTPLWGAAITAANWPDKRKACMVVINDLLRAGANPERALLVPTENPALKLPRDDKEIMELLQSRPIANKK